jgi:hypothetical protein
MLVNFKTRSLAILWVAFVAVAWGVIIWTIAEGPINSLDIILALVATLGAYMSAVFGYSWIRGSDLFREAPQSSQIRDMLENIDRIEDRNRMVINVPADPAEAYPPLDSLEDDVEVPLSAGSALIIPRMLFNHDLWAKAIEEDIRDNPDSWGGAEAGAEALNTLKDYVNDYKTARQLIEESLRNNEWDEINELVKEYRNERDH